MRFYGKRKIKLGPIVLNFSLTDGRPRFTSWGIKLGPLAHNFTHRTSTFDTPGVGYVKHAHGRGDR